MNIQPTTPAAHGYTPDSGANSDTTDAPALPKPRSKHRHRKLKQQNKASKSHSGELSDKQKVAKALHDRGSASIQHIPNRVLKETARAETAHLPKEIQNERIAEKLVMKQVQKIVQEGRTEDVRKILGTKGSCEEITNGIHTIIKKQEQLSGKPQIPQQLQLVKDQPATTQLKTLKTIALDLSDTLKRKSKNSLTETDKKHFHDWFIATKNLILKIDTTEPSIHRKLNTIAEDTANLFKIMIDRELIDQKLIPYVPLTQTFENLYHLSTNQSISKPIRVRLTTIIESLCYSFEKSEIAKQPAFINLRKKSLTIHLKSLNPEGINLPSRKTLETLTHLMEIAPDPENLFLYIKTLVNFHGLVDFGDEELIRKNIEKIAAPEVSKALKSYLDGNIEEVCTLDSQNTIIIWLKAMIAINHEFSIKKAKQLLIEAAKKDDSMHFQLALFYLEHWQSPSLETLETIKYSLETSQSKTPETEQMLWLQCNTKVNQLILLAKESEKPISNSEFSTPDPSDKNDINSSTEAHPSESPDIEKRDERITDLSSAISLAQNLIKLFQKTPHTTSDDVKAFTVIGYKGKKLNHFESMMPENRNPVITRLLRHIHICRIFNNLKEEIRCYEILKEPKFIFMIQFERLLEEAVWTLLHCTEDPHSGGLKSRKKERIEALGLAKQLMIICLQHTIKQPEILFDEQLTDDTIRILCNWLNNPDNFGGDKKLQQYMRHNIRYRAGSGLGHIFRFIQEVSGRDEMEEMATHCFRAKTLFDPCYKPEVKYLIEKRSQHYQRVTFSR